jgi:hypothetical protein
LGTIRSFAYFLPVMIEDVPLRVIRLPRVGSLLRLSEELRHRFAACYVPRRGAGCLDSADF